MFYVFRDEQYRQLWAEMETFLQTMSSTSKMHGRVYNYLRGDPENDEENSNDSMSIQNESKLLCCVTVSHIIFNMVIETWFMSIPGQWTTQYENHADPCYYLPNLIVLYPCFNFLQSYINVSKSKIIVLIRMKMLEIFLQKPVFLPKAN